MKFLYTLNRSISQPMLDLYEELGASAFRVNFGRGEIDENVQCIERIIRRRDAEVFIDLPGSKPRLGKYQEGKVYYKKGEKILLTSNAACCQTVCALNNDNIENYEVGDHITASSGLKLQVCSKNHIGWDLITLNDGELYSYCGFFNINKIKIRTELSRKEICIANRLREFESQKLSGICPSFTDDVRVISETRMLFEKQKIISKIETPIGVKNMYDILEKSDGLMLCRGDLSIFYTEEELFELGKQMASACRAYKNKVFIAATDFFSNYVKNENEIKKDALELEKYLALMPDYILINETSYCSKWENIVRQCQEYV